MKTLHRPLWEGVQYSLKEIFIEGRPADKVIQQSMKANRKWGSHDRRLFAETVYDLVRWWRRLLFAAEVEWPESDRWDIDDPAIVARVIEGWCALHDVKLGNHIEPTGIDTGLFHTRWDDREAPLAVRQSIPNWLDEMGQAQLGKEWPEILQELNKQAPVFLRANRLKTDAATVLNELKNQKLEATNEEDDVIRLNGRANVFLSPAFERGFFEVQDRNSQRVAPALRVQPGQRVIDACAGAGGKTLHLAALMQNKGKIVAMDVGPKKLEELRRRSTRAGATIIEVRLIESTKTVKRLESSADRVLLDVPCSGLGVLRRNPDAKWKLRPEEIQNLNKLQADILRLYSQMCKPGGMLVYATCSILPSENQQQVAAFLNASEGRWKLEDEQTFYPEEGSGDGFYFARLLRVPG